MFVGHVELAIALIEKGCDVNVHGSDTLSPFEEAVKKKLSKVWLIVDTFKIKIDKKMLSWKIVIPKKG